MSVRSFISANRWPMFVLGIMVMTFSAYVVLVYVATRPNAPRPIANFYQRSLEWDADAAIKAASQKLGWSVQLEIPRGAQYAVAASRPVDVTVRDREGAPVTGLSGQLVAVRPADTRLDNASALTELPHAPGHYRALARLAAPGIWELSVDASLGTTRFVYTQRISVDIERQP